MKMNEDHVKNLIMSFIKMKRKALTQSHFFHVQLIKRRREIRRNVHLNHISHVHLLSIQAHVSSVILRANSPILFFHSLAKANTSSTSVDGKESRER